MSSARIGWESVCHDRVFRQDARIDLPGYFQDTFHHPVGVVAGSHPRDVQMRFDVQELRCLTCWLVDLDTLVEGHAMLKEQVDRLVMPSCWGPAW